MKTKTDDQLRVEFISTSAQVNLLAAKESPTYEEVILKKNLQIELDKVTEEMHRRLDLRKIQKSN